jgi:hypothetical protein
MDYSEFLRRIGADPHDPDQELLRARQSDIKFEQAALDAERLETKLQRAVQLPAPEGLIEQLQQISQTEQSTSEPSRRWRHLAVAAGLLIAVGAAGISWNLNHSWESVDEYVAQHYRHDGDSVLRKAGENSDTDVQALFARFDVVAETELAEEISLIKYCPTPDGKGIHMVLNTAQGPVTVIYMPETDVQDHQGVNFDRMKALYVDLEKGSAIIIGNQQQPIESLYALVQRSIVPNNGKA